MNHAWQTDSIGPTIATAYGCIVAAVEGELRDAVRAMRRHVWP